LRVADNACNAVLFGDGNTSPVSLQTHDRYVSTAEGSHGRAEYAYGARTYDDHPVARLDSSIGYHRTVGYAAGFGQTGLFERQVIGYLVQDARWYAYKPGHGAVYTVAKSLAGRIQVVQSLTGHGIVMINDGRGF